MLNTLPFVIDMPHDGDQGYELAKPELQADHRLGRDYGVQRIFSGHNVLHEAVGSCWRDLCDLNRLTSDEDDAQFKVYATELSGQNTDRVRLWKQGCPSGEVKQQLLSRYYNEYIDQLVQATQDDRVACVIFAHSMPNFASHAKTSVLPMGTPNALISIGNGGDVKGEGADLLCSTEQALFLRQAFEQALQEYIEPSVLSGLLEGRDAVALNQYKGLASSGRLEPTRTGKVPSVLIEMNRSLIGDPADPMFEVLAKAKVDMPKRVDHTVVLNKITSSVLTDFANVFFD